MAVLIFQGEVKDGEGRSYFNFAGVKQKTKVIDNNLDPVWDEVRVELFLGFKFLIYHIAYIRFTGYQNWPNNVRMV